MLKQHGPAWRPYEQTILKWANAYKVDPLYVAAVLLTENASANPNAVSSTGAVGPGQIQDSKVDPSLNPNAVWDGPPTLSPDWKKNFANSVKYVSWRLAGAVAHYGSLDGAYSGADGALRGYNPGFTGVGPSQFLPKGYIGQGSSGTSPTPAETAGVSVAGSTARADITDPWVVVKNGRITTQTGDQPKNVLTYGSLPMRLSDYNQYWKQTYADQFFAYTGRQATPAEQKQILESAISTYTLANQLAEKPSFVGSPVYKQHAPALLADARSIMGNTFNPPKGMIAEAIAGNWDQATFEQTIRGLPSYKTSVEYKTNFANLEQTFEGVYGNQPDPSIKKLLDQATTQGWSPAEFQSWLMGQDAYKQSPAYQAKMQTFLTQLGLITGAVPTLSKDQIDQALKSGDNLTLPGVPGKTPGPTGAPGATPQTPGDKPTGVGPTGFNAPFTPTTMISGEKKNEGPFTRKVA